jgi:hypothetical protein
MVNGVADRDVMHGWASRLQLMRGRYAVPRHSRSRESPSGTCQLELEQETDGRWLPEVAARPGATTYGVDQDRSRGTGAALGTADAS